MAYNNMSIHEGHYPYRQQHGKSRWAHAALTAALRAGMRVLWADFNGDVLFVPCDEESKIVADDCPCDPVTVEVP